MPTLSAHHDGVDLAYQRFGSTGDPVLLIIGADMLYWHDEFCSALIGQGFQVARFDNRDSGESTHLDWAGTNDRRRVGRYPETAPYRLEEMADDAAAVLDALGWPSAHIVGHSMGGMIAQTLAIRHRDRVRSLTCISSTPSPDVGRARPLTLLRLLRANPAILTGTPPRGPADAGERPVRGHRVIGSPGYPLDETWLRHIGELMYRRGGFDPAARARQGELTAVSQRGNGVDQFQQRRFIVSHPPRPQPLPSSIDDHAVVIRFPSINTSPQRLAHNHLPARCRSDQQPSRRPRRRVLTQRSKSHLSISGRVVAGQRAANLFWPSQPATT